MTVYFPNLNQQENEAEAPIGEENLWQVSRFNYFF